MNIAGCFRTLNFCGFIAYILGENICGLFQVLAQFLFTKSETLLEYYHQKENV